MVGRGCGGGFFGWFCSWRCSGRALLSVVFIFFFFLSNTELFVLLKWFAIGMETSWGLILLGWYFDLCLSYGWSGMNTTARGDCVFVCLMSFFFAFVIL